MRDLAVLVLHLLATVARLVGPGGARSVVAESVLVKHQRLILNRSRKRSPNLRPADRVVVGLCALFMRPGRLIRSAIVFKASTLLSLHRALIQRKYRWLFSSKGPTRPGPREPRQEVIAAVVDMKQRNPTWGCPRIAHQITLAFGIPINKDALEIEDSQPRLLLAAERSRLIHSRIHTGPMTRTWMPSFVAFVLAAAGVYAGADGDDPKFVVPNVPDLIVKTRETIDLPQSTVRTNTLYFKGAWQRRELYLQFPSALPAQRTVRHATITRCDERRTLELNHDARLYGWSPLNFIGRDVYWGRSRWRERPEPPCSAGT